ncbi:response regulator [Rugamonas sp. FT107W]|uniref:Response regulator n=1 Tax=Duganella vulcania TaxID=2692166 RepID=A0A845HQ44_9BURK|nr:HD domain-containing phosphohydrolase [Duganella vulcania]MYN20928.1 response regulator [Duganella vulcania]
MQILIVDDNPANLELFGHMLEMLSDTPPVSMSDPGAALAWCADNDPDLVLVDYMMPEIDGLEFLRRFRALPGKEQTPLVMVTADTQNKIRHEALRLSANDFLTKPVNFIELNARVGNLLALGRAQRQLAHHAARLADEVRKATADIAAREREAIYRLSRAAEFRDPETGSHLLRMAAFSELIARNLGLPEDECERILAAAPMHDIGKLGIPDAILLKPGPLDSTELEIMRRHAQIGADILADSASPLLQAGALIAASHHERYDGSGYPRGLAGEAIPLYGRIVAAADVFDALTSARPYKPAWSFAQARSAMEAGCGSHFDPACVAALFRDEAALAAIRQRYDDHHPSPQQQLKEAA